MPLLLLEPMDLCPLSVNAMQDNIYHCIFWNVFTVLLVLHAQKDQHPPHNYCVSLHCFLYLVLLRAARVLQVTIANLVIHVLDVILEHTLMIVQSHVNHVHQGNMLMCQVCLHAYCVVLEHMQQGMVRLYAHSVSLENTFRSPMLLSVSNVRQAGSLP